MVTKKVAGTGLASRPAVMFPENSPEPGAHGVKVRFRAPFRNISRTGIMRGILRYIPFTAVFFAVFGIGEMHDHTVVGALCIVAAVSVLWLPQGGAR